jgi:orotate phosphoribosyltransferase-like protein
VANPNQIANPDAVDAAPRRLAALELRKKGKSYRAIADELNVSVSTAHAYVVEGIGEIREQTAQKAEELVALELVRLDDMLDALWDKRGEPSTANTILKIMERRAKMLGTDAPVDLRLGGIPGGAPIQSTNALDLSKLTMDDLVQLHSLYEKGAPPRATV